MSATQDTKDMMPTGLIRRGGSYSIRRRVPVDLVGVFDCREIVRALGTSDPKEARAKWPIFWAELDRQFAQAREALSGRDQTPVDHLSPTLIAISNLDRLRLEREDAIQRGELPAFNQTQRDALRLIQAMLDGDVPMTESALVLEGKRNGLRAFLTGDGALALSARRVAPPQSELENQVRAGSATTWLQLCEKWAAERKKDVKSIAAHRAVANSFVSLTGRKLVEESTRRDVLEFKDSLVAKGDTPATIKVKLSRFRTLSNYAYANDLLATKIATDIKVEVDRREAKRLPFDAPALAALFNGPVHALGDRPAGGRGEASYWMPLIALYSGATLEEIGQLRVIDVTLQTYPTKGGADASSWFIRFQSDEGDDLKLKTAERGRLVPLHPELQRLGFLRYVEWLTVAGHARIFPSLKPNVYGRLAAKWGEWFSSYLRQVCGVSDKRIVFHSFRHTFKDIARDCGIPDPIQRQLMGHSARGVADTYGRGFSREALVNAMNLYRVAGQPQLAPQP